MDKGMDEMHQQIAEKFRDKNILSIILISAEEIVVSDWVKLKCRFGCDSYGTNHACSPATMAVEEFRKILKEYRKALLVTGKGAGLENQNVFIEALTDLEREYFLKGFYKAFALTNGPCQRCKRCTYPDKCIKPKLVRPAAESVGIDMFATLKNLDKQIKVLDGEEEFFCYGLILLE